MKQDKKPFEFDFCAGIYGFQAESMTVFSNHMRDEFKRRGICFNEITINLTKLRVGKSARMILGVLCRYFIYPLKVRFSQKTGKVFIADSANAAIINMLPKEVKSIIFLHGLAYQEDSRTLGIDVDFKDRLILFASRIFKRPGLLNCNLIIANSNKGRDDFLRFIRGMKQKTVVVAPLGLSPYLRKTESIRLRKELGLSDKTKIILSVAAPDLRKNIDTLVNALDCLEMKYMNWVWVHVGGLHPRVEKTIGAALQHKSILIQKVKHEEMPQYYSLADVFVLPTRYDTFGWPPLEAAACGCPVIVSDILPLNENLRDVAKFVNPDSSTDIAEAIFDLLTNENLAQEFSDNGYSVKEKFTWEKTGDIVLKAIMELDQQN